MAVSRYKVIKSYKVAYSDPIIARSGERLRFERRESEWAGWIWCRAADGREGWVPESRVAVDVDECRLLRDYSAAELTAGAGEKLTVEEIESGWAWAVNDAGASGWFPLENLEAD